MFGLDFLAAAGNDLGVIDATRATPPGNRQPGLYPRHPMALFFVPVPGRRVEPYLNTSTTM